MSGGGAEGRGQWSGGRKPSARWRRLRGAAWLAAGRAGPGWARGWRRRWRSRTCGYHVARPLGDGAGLRPICYLPCGLCRGGSGLPLGVVPPWPAGPSAPRR